MSGDYGFATNDAQMQHLRRILKQHGYNDEVVDTVIARNTEAAAANAAPQHNQTLARPSRSKPAPSVEDIFYTPAPSDDDGGFGVGLNAGTPVSGEDRQSCDEPRDSSLVGGGGGEAKAAAQQPQHNPEPGPETKFLDVSVWLEAVDPKHRYSKSLKKYFCFWQQQQQLQDEKAGLPPRDLRLPRRKSVIELGRIRDRIAAAFGSESGEQNQAALWELRKRYGIDIAAHRGEWVEAHDSATGRTVYYHVPTRRVQKAMPRGWVGMVVRDING